MTSIDNIDFSNMVAVGNKIDNPVVIDQGVLEAIYLSLQNVSFSDIRNEFKHRLNSCSNITEYIKTLEGELSFHSTIQDIRKLREESCGKIEP